MRLIRQIEYEGTEEALKRQMKNSLGDGVRQPGAVKMTIRTITVSDDGEVSAGLSGQRHGDGWWSTEEKP